MTITFTNARVFDGTSMLPETQTVSLDGDRIVSIAAGHAVPGAEVIDLGGMTLMPGLITCHFHPDFYRFTLAQGLAGDPLGKEFPPGVMMAMAIRNGRVLLDSGFTGYIGASCSNDVDAQLKIAIAEGIVEGPRLRACSPHIGTTGDLNDSKLWWRKQVTPGTDVFFDGPDAMRRIVREYIRRGSQTIKIFASQGHGFPSRVSRNMDRDEIAAIAQAAHGRGAKVRAHVADKAMIMECIELGVDILDHGDEIDAEAIAAMAEKGTFWVPSLIYPKCLLQLGWGNADMQRLYDHVRDTLPAAQAAGVRILAGDDYSGVFREVIEDDPLDHQVGNYGREFGYYAAIPGLNAAQVLSWGTKNAGEALLDGEDRLGVIASGVLADLIVIDGDPVADPAILAHPQQALKAVIQSGAFTIDRLPPGARRTAGTGQGMRAA
ncbi:amidohydrolase family protein [Novosphingobium beihaiensis]|uniref:Amidohydrolase family protein n=1 Tax=Novosphingobium beihaiensis TaxID=2930389 RepID=A0ABT0BML2_9SPHN|nr:amidohydrolase family protein [Novosphingobium beihaiensis]MCJ2186283.1 amidohydrolase family protein [Novosphingobium beihaiensis]